MIHLDLDLSYLDATLLVLIPIGCTLAGACIGWWMRGDHNRNDLPSTLRLALVAGHRRRVPSRFVTGQQAVHRLADDTQPLPLSTVDGGVR